MQTPEQLQSGLEHVRKAPCGEGKLVLLVRRPAPEERELLERGLLDTERGLLGDDWSQRPNAQTDDGGPDPDAQITLMGARAAALVAGGQDHERWASAGDQLYVDLDLGVANLPVGTRLAIGEAVLEVTAEPHLGCGKFSRRFGLDALKFVNSAVGRDLRLRGVNARVIESGEIAAGDGVRKLD